MKINQIPGLFSLQVQVLEMRVLSQMLTGPSFVPVAQKHMETPGTDGWTTAQSSEGLWRAQGGGKGAGACAGG